jgi:hypothetical protein
MALCALKWHTFLAYNIFLQDKLSLKAGARCTLPLTLYIGCSILIYTANGRLLKGF